MSDPQDLIDIDECEEFAGIIAFQMINTFNATYSHFNGWYEVLFARPYFQVNDFHKRAHQVVKNHVLTDLLMDDAFNQHKRQSWNEVSTSQEFWTAWYASPLFATNKKYSVLDCQNQLKGLKSQNYIGEITASKIKRLQFVIDCGGALGMSTSDLLQALDQQCQEFVLQTPDIRKSSTRSFKI